MPDLSAVRPEAAIVHFAGNKAFEENLQLSDEILDFKDPRIEGVLQKILGQTFKTEEMFRFQEPADHGSNPVKHYCAGIINSPDNLLEQSQAIARFLHDKTDDPTLKGGFVVVVYLSKCVTNRNETEGVAILKFESKENFLKFNTEVGQIDINFEEGIPATRPEKACLVLNVDAELGYEVYYAMNGRSGDAKYWMTDCLALRAAEDPFHFTSNVLKVTKEFVTKEMPDEFPLSKTDTIEILNRSLSYFKENENFDKNEFAETVFVDDRVIDSFKKYDEDYCKYNDLPTADTFEIDNKAVKKQAKIFKSVLKLDKDFHIYIHGNREKIERGVDPDGRKYYKIYFEEEE